MHPEPATASPHAALNPQLSTLNFPQTALDASEAVPSYTADFRPEPSRVRNPDTYQP